MRVPKKWKFNKFAHHDVDPDQTRRDFVMRASQPSKQEVEIETHRVSKSDISADVGSDDPADASIKDSDDSYLSYTACSCERKRDVHQDLNLHGGFELYREYARCYALRKQINGLSIPLVAEPQEFGNRFSKRNWLKDSTYELGRATWQRRNPWKPEAEGHVKYAGGSQDWCAAMREKVDPDCDQYEKLLRVPTRMPDEDGFDYRTNVGQRRPRRGLSEFAGFPKIGSQGDLEVPFQICEMESGNGLLL